jgi:hypothetical protein
MPVFISRSTDFAAYARNFCRGQLAGRLAHNIEVSAAARPQCDIFDLLFGGELASQHLAGECLAVARQARPVERNRSPRR